MELGAADFIRVVINVEGRRGVVSTSSYSYLYFSLDVACLVGNGIVASPAVD